MYSPRIGKLMQELRDCDDFKKFTTVINENIYGVAEDLNIGKIDLEFNVPKSLYSNEMYIKDYNLYSNEYNDTAVCVDCDIEYNGYMKVYLYPKKDYIWKEDDACCIFVIGNFILTALNKLRYKDLVGDALLRDGLTNCYNISGIMRLLSGKNLETYNCMFLNIKNFKFVNKSLGYGDANRVLNMFCRNIENKIMCDEFFARTGGDNFVLFIKKENTQKMIDFLGAVDIKGNYWGYEREFNLSCKLGIYVIEKGDVISDAIEKASIALSIAKNVRKNDVIFFDKGIEERLSFEKDIINSFASAINNREFMVYYQPKVDATNNEIKGAEALVRWKRNGKLIPPGLFIPVLEKENYVCDLDYYVLDETCNNIKNWIKNGIEPVCISVNFSKRHLNNKNMAERILNIINKYNIPHKFIEIEITESIDFMNTEEINGFINTLKSSGVHVSLDDFGTGYSSLGALMDMNFDVIKLDKSFIDNINKEISHNNIIINMINLIKLFNATIVAEGVEDKTQVEFLVKNGCNMIQGYVFDKPLEHNDFKEKLKNRFY